MKKEVKERRVLQLVQKDMRLSPSKAWLLVLLST